MPPAMLALRPALRRGLARQTKEPESRELGQGPVAANSARSASSSDSGAKSGILAVPEDHTHDELNEKNVKDSAYAAGVKKAAEENRVGHSRNSLGSGVVGEHSSPRESSSGVAANDAPSTGSEPLVEVIGVKDRDKARKIALKATRDLEAKGEPVQNSKIVVDANKREIYIEQNPSDAQHTKDAERAQRQAEAAESSHSRSSSASVPAALGSLGAFGIPSGSTSGAAVGSNAQSHPPVAASFDLENPREVDPRAFHRQHQAAKEALEEDAREGTLGAIPPQNGQFGSAFGNNSSGNGVSRSSGTSTHEAAQVIGAAAAAGAIAAHRDFAAKSSNQSVEPDATFFEENPREVDPRQFHGKHEKVKHELEEFAEEGRLGGIEPPSARNTGAAFEHIGHSGNLQSANVPADAAFDEPNPRDVDPRAFHRHHEKVRDELEELAEDGQLGNIRTDVPSLGRREPRPTVSDGLGLQSSLPESKSSAYQNVKVVGVKDTAVAEKMAKEAVVLVQGRHDVLERTSELRVDAAGAVTDQDGTFLASLGHSLLDQGGQARKLPEDSGSGVVASTLDQAGQGSYNGSSNGSKADFASLGEHQPYAPQKKWDTTHHHSKFYPSGTSGHNPADLENRRANLRTDDKNAEHLSQIGQGPLASGNSGSTGVGGGSTVPMPGSFEFS